MSVPDSVVFGHRTLGVGAGIWERTKGLLNHHIAAATARERERETLHCFPLSDFFFFSKTIASTAACYLWRGSVV